MRSKAAGSEKRDEMKKGSAALDAYIAKAPDFARPILEKVRRLMHEACPDIEEVMKWGHPHFDYRGPVAGMAAFKQHAAFGFWKAQLLSDSEDHLSKAGSSMSRDKLTDVSQLPPDKVLLRLIREAADLNTKGVKTPKSKKPPKKPLAPPDYFTAALRKNKKAEAAFKALSPSHQREYIEWLIEAKQEATRQKRLATAIEWIAEGKPRNWKYMK
jgi:uncharacterized protein YdeI (YjbR/CyaY-like superfamily)